MIINFKTAIGGIILLAVAIGVGIKIFVHNDATPPGQPTAADLLQMQNDKAAIKEGLEQQMKEDQDAALIKQRKQLTNRY